MCQCILCSHFSINYRLHCLLILFFRWLWIVSATVNFTAPHTHCRMTFFPRWNALFVVAVALPSKSIPMGSYCELNIIKEQFSMRFSIQLFDRLFDMINLLRAWKFTICTPLKQVSTPSTCGECEQCPTLHDQNTHKMQEHCFIMWTAIYQALRLCFTQKWSLNTHVPVSGTLRAIYAICYISAMLQCPTPIRSWNESETATLFRLSSCGM